MEEVRSAAEESQLEHGTRFNSELHADVSRVLSSLGVEHRNRVAAGPMLLDVYFKDMFILEAAATWQFYLRSAHLTALARRRHEMLEAMGFQLTIVECHRWEKLSEEAKRDFLSKALPKKLRPKATSFACG